MRNSGILLLFLLIGTTPAQDVAAPPLAELDLIEIRQRVTDGKAQLIDVRTKPEWDRSHVDEAQHIPLTTLTENATRDKAIANIDKSKRIYVHCAKGKRAAMAANLLCELGFDCQALETDYEDICAAGFEEIVAE